jgi:hypothetical protein
LRQKLLVHSPLGTGKLAKVKEESMREVSLETKQKYWDELAQVAGALASNFTKLLKSPGRCYGNAVDGGQLRSSEHLISVNPELSPRDDYSRLEPVDPYLAQNLLVNLAAEFVEIWQTWGLARTG